MCWEGKVSDRKIATRDIKTKKIVEFINGSYCGYFQRNFRYELGKTYTAKIKPYEQEPSDTYCMIDAGLHSYAWDTKMTRSTYSDIVIICSRECGILSRRFYFFSNPILAMECTIPKGTVYYENKCGEIVSEKLIINKQIECKFE